MGKNLHLMSKFQLQEIETQIRYNQEGLLKIQTNKTEYNMHLKNVIRLYNESLNTQLELKYLKTDTVIYRRIGNILLEQNLEDVNLTIIRKMEIHRREKAKIKKRIKVETNKAVNYLKNNS